MHKGHISCMGLDIYRYSVLIYMPIHVYRFGYLSDNPQWGFPVIRIVYGIEYFSLRLTGQL